jgi:TctA family transporter
VDRRCRRVAPRSRRGRAGGETFAALLQGLTVAAQPGNLLFAGAGVILGTLVGILPGISPSLTVALLLPVTFKMDTTGSISTMNQVEARLSVPSG